MVVLLGVIVPFKVIDSPTYKLALVLSNVIPVISIGFCLTVIVAVTFFPLLVLAVIVADPTPFATTFPLLSTVATFWLLLLHAITFDMVVLLGVIVPFKVIDSPTYKLALVLSNVIPVISITGLEFSKIVTFVSNFIDTLPTERFVINVVTPDLIPCIFPFSNIAIVTSLD